MKLLAIETSTSKASVALKVGDESFTLEEQVLQRHAEWVLPAVSKVLNQAGLALKELEGIVFGQGPGSFTGLRIACSIVKGLAVGSDLPLYPVSGLASIASQVQSADILTVIDARMQAWYWAVYREGRLVEQEQVSHPSTILLKGNAKFYLAGVGFEALLQTLPESLLERVIATQVIYPSALSMIHLTESGLVKAVSAQEAKPIYIRQEVTHG